ncbi:MAG: o-succinylbenzoate synthase [Polyangiales bacterium]
MIERIDVAAVRVEIPTVRNAIRHWDVREALLVTVQSDDGGRGQGEASPLPGFSHETLDAARAALASAPLPWAAPTTERFEETFPRLAVPSASFAMETAFRDWWSVAHGKPFESSFGVPVAPIALARLVDSPDAAAQAVEAGFGTLKFKVGVDLDEELACLRATREVVPVATRLRLDANGVLGPTDAAAWLDAVADLNIEFIEEPVPWSKLTALRDVRVPLALDESLVDAEAWPAVDELRRAVPLDTIVLKPSVLGGFARLRALADDGRARGMRVIFSHAFGGPIELRAALACAAAFGTRDAAHGLAEHRTLEGWPGVRMPGLRGAHFDPPTDPGLGLPFLAERMGGAP